MTWLASDRGRSTRRGSSIRALCVIWTGVRDGAAGDRQTHIRLAARTSARVCARACGREHGPPEAARRSRFRGVVKRFGEITAVNGLDLEVPPGVCFGLLGTQRGGQVDDDADADRPDAGRRGHDLGARLRAAAGIQAVAPGDGGRAAARQPRRGAHLPPDPDRLRPALPGPAAPSVRRPSSGRSRSPTWCPRADTIVRELSGGMRRRLLVARGLIHRPRLVLLDEPTVGLDPQIRQELWSLIDGLRAEGVTVLMSTHYIEEAERLADTVAVMSAGRIIAQGTPAELVGAHAGEQVLEVYGPPERLAEVDALARENGWQSRRSGAGGGDPPRRDARRPGARGSAPPGQPRGRVRGADRRGDRVSAHAQDMAATTGPHAVWAGWNRRRWRA